MSIQPGGPVRQIQSIHQQEADFHDQWARSIPVQDIPVRQTFEAPTALENRFILQKMGSLRGVKVLDIGCGLGESSTYFAMCGAEVTATDLSPQMVDCAVRLAEYHGAKIQGVVSAAEALDVQPEGFDIVYTANTIHHVTDKSGFFGQIFRALRPGGRFFTLDPLAYNPVINIYRAMATRVRTADETPLTFADLQLACRTFQNVNHREFWIAGLTLFLKYYLIDGLHPNDDRYWKRIFHETPASLWWWMPFRAADSALTVLPLVRRLAWNMVMWGTKPI